MAAERDVNIRIGSTNAARPGFAGVRSELDGLKGSVGEAAKSVHGLGSAMAALAAVGAAQFLRSSVVEAAAAERINAQLARSLANVGVSYAAASGAIERFSAKQQQSTLYDGEAVKQALTSLIDLTGQYNDETLVSVKIAEDLATATGLDLLSATQAVGRAIDGNFKALGQYVPSLRQLGAETLNAMDAGERLALVQQEVARAYGPASEAIGGQTLAIARLSNSWGDLKEAIGGLAGSSAGTGILSVIIKDISNATNALGGSVEDIGQTLLRFNPFTGLQVSLIELFDLEDDLVGFASTVLSAWDRLLGVTEADARRSAEDLGKAFAAWGLHSKYAGEQTDELNGSLAQISPTAGGAKAALSSLANSAKEYADQAERAWQGMLSSAMPGSANRSQSLSYQRQAGAISAFTPDTGKAGAERVSRAAEDSLKAQADAARKKAEADAAWIAFLITSGTAEGERQRAAMTSLDVSPGENSSEESRYMPAIRAIGEAQRQAGEGLSEVQQQATDDYAKRAEQAGKAQEQLATQGIGAALSLGQLAINAVAAGQGMKEVAGALLKQAGGTASQFGGVYGQAIGAGLQLAGTALEAFGKQDRTRETRREQADRYTEQNPMPVKVVDSDVPTETRVVNLYVRGSVVAEKDLGRYLRDVQGQA